MIKILLRLFPDLKRKEQIKDNDKKVFFIQRTIGNYSWLYQLTPEQLEKVRYWVNTFIEWDKSD